MILVMARFRAYCLEVHWDIIMANLLALMKASNWGGKLLGNILGNVYVITLGIYAGTDMGC